VNRAELDARLLELEREIQTHRTAIWMCERSRDEALFDLRRLIATESKEVKP
jgi:hypothetical protein